MLSGVAMLPDNMPPKPKRGLVFWFVNPGVEYPLPLKREFAVLAPIPRAVSHGCPVTMPARLAIEPMLPRGLEPFT